MQASPACPDRGTPRPHGPGPTSTGPWLLDDVFDQPVDPLVQRQAPQERNLPGRRVVSRASVCLLATTQAQRLRNLPEPPSPTSEQPRTGQEAPHTSRKGEAGKGKQSTQDEMVQPPSPAWGLGGSTGGAAEGWAGTGGDRLTHRVQLPLEYDEGHETNNDEDRAEAQVGKEVAREITWGGAGGYRENRMTTEHGKQKRGQHPAS